MGAFCLLQALWKALRDRYVRSYAVEQGQKQRVCSFYCGRCKHIASDVLPNKKRGLLHALKEVSCCSLLVFYKGDSLHVRVVLR